MTKIVTALLLIFLMLFSGCIIVSHASAAPTLIIVPVNYPTIAAAIGNATEGDTIFIRSGTYSEHSLIIDKTVSLVGENSQTTVIQNIDKPDFFLSSSMKAGPTTINVEPQADNVKITRLTIKTNNVGADKTFAGFSIKSYGDGTQIYENILPDGISFARQGQAGPVGSNKLVTANVIGQVADNFAIISEAPYTYIYNNTIIGGVKLQNCYGNGDLNNVIYDNTITTSASYPYWQAYGVTIYMTQGNLIAKNNITNSRAGIVADLSSYNTIVGNTITDSYIGLASIQGGGENEFYGNTITGCSYSAAVAGANNYYYHNNFIGNQNELADPNSLMGPNDQRSIYWSKNNQGNYWSNYTGIDANNDGIGDTPYVMDADNMDRYPLMATFTQAAINLPSWTNNLTPSEAPSIPAQSLTPSPSSTQATSETTTPTTTPSFDATEGPEPSTTRQVEPNNRQQSADSTDTDYVLPVVIAIIAILATVAIMVIIRKRSRKHSASYLTR